MAKTRAIQNSFLSGELSPLLLGNTSIAQYYQGLRQALNCLIVPQGGVKRRAGMSYGFTPQTVFSRYTGSNPTMPNGGTGANINDGDTATNTTTTTSISTTANYVVAQYDLGSAQDVVFIDLISARITTFADFDEFDIQHSDDGATWVGGYTQVTLKSTAATKRIIIGATHRYWRFVRVGTKDLGSGRVNLAEFNVLLNSSTLSNAKVFSIQSEGGVDYLCCLTDGNLRISSFNGTSFTDGENIKVPYLTSEVSQVRHKTIGSVTLLFHENHPVKRVINYGDEGAANKNPTDNNFYWYTDDAPFINIPQFDFNDNLSPTPVAAIQEVTFGSFTVGMKYQIDVEGVFSKNITYAGDSTADEQAATAFNLQKNLQDMPNFGDTGITVTRIGVNQYRITMDGESAGDYKLFSGFNTSGGTGASMTFVQTAVGTSRSEDIWSATRGYPRMGEFWEGRLWIGGTRDKPQTLISSNSGSLLNFELGEGDDDQSIFVTLSARGNSSITDIYAGRTLQIFTSSGEYAVTDQGATPATINVRLQSSNGSLSVPVQEADGAVVYCDKNGKTLREFLFSFNEDAYASNDISVLSSHLIKTPVSMAFLTGTASEDANWLFVVNSDGTGAVLHKLRSQDINAFTPIETDGTLKDCAVFGEQLAFVVDRVINGVTQRYVERLSFDHLMDSSVRATVSGTSVSGLSHLNGETVTVLIGSTELDSRAVSAGAITLTSTEAAAYNGQTIEVGVNFDVNVQPMPINTNVGSGENFMRLKKVVRMNLRVLSTAGIYIDGEPVPIRSFGASVLDTLVQPFTGIIDDVYPIDGWSRDEMPLITFPSPGPMHIQAIEMEVESA